MDQSAHVAGDRTSPEYLTTAQAAQLTGFSCRALENLRARGEGPSYCRIGKSIRYPIADLRRWIEDGRISQ